MSDSADRADEGAPRGCPKLGQGTWTYSLLHHLQRVIFEGGGHLFFVGSRDSYL